MSCRSSGMASALGTRSLGSQPWLPAAPEAPHSGWHRRGWVQLLQQQVPQVTPPRHRTQGQTLPVPDPPGVCSTAGAS